MKNTIILAKYSDFTNILLKKLIKILQKYIRENKNNFQLKKEVNSHSISLFIV